MGITIANFISLFLAGGILIYTSLDLEVLVYLFFCTILFFGNLILFIIGFIIKKTIKDDTIRLNKSSFYTFLYVILLIILILLIIPSTNDNINEKMMLKNSINYLSNKYGDDNFKIVEIEKDYAYEGIISARKSRYELTVSSPLLKDNFTMYADNEHFFKIKNVTDFFIETYYNQKMNDYLSKKYNIELDIWIREEKIPEICGHIPTIDELADLNAIDYIHIRTRNDNYDKDINERIDYIKQISKDLIDKFKISRDINMNLRKYGFSNSYSYEVQMSENIIKIIDEDNKTTVYECNINDIESKN